MLPRGCSPGALDGQRNQVLIADKVWTPSPQEGAAQLARAVQWYGGRVDVMQIGVTTWVQATAH